MFLEKCCCVSFVVSHLCFALWCSANELLLDVHVVRSLLYSVSKAMTWLSHLRIYIDSLAWVYHSWVNPLGFDKHINQPICASWCDTDLSFPHTFLWKVTFLRGKGKRKKRERRKRNILGFPRSCLMRWWWARSGKSYSDWHPYLTVASNGKGIRRGQTCNDTYPNSPAPAIFSWGTVWAKERWHILYKKILDAFFFCTYSVTSEPCYISNFHTLLVAMSAQIGPHEQFSLL